MGERVCTKAWLFSELWEGTDVSHQILGESQRDGKIGWWIFACVRNSKCLKSLLLHRVVQTGVGSGVRDVIESDFPFETVRTFVIKDCYYFQREWDLRVFFFITPLSALSGKKVKPKSITFDKQCLVWLPYLSLCRALLGTAWGKGKKKRKNTISKTVTGRRETCTYNMLMMHQGNVFGMQLFSVSMHFFPPFFSCSHKKNISFNNCRRKAFFSV